MSRAPGCCGADKAGNCSRSDSEFLIRTVASDKERLVLISGEKCLEG
jgi:hypothetical protein